MALFDRSRLPEIEAAALKTDQAVSERAAAFRALAFAGCESAL
jgi:hypothetical protein